MLTIVVGAQFGDEGKGRVVHNLALMPQYYAAARAQGANNAGHTVKHNGDLYKLHLLPSSVLVGKPGFLGCGMALDLGCLVDEVRDLQGGGLKPKFMIDERAHVIMPWHKELDEVLDTNGGKYAADSTRRGVAPVYASKYERTGIRVVDFFSDPDRVKQMLQEYAGRVAYHTGKEKGDLVNDYRKHIDATREKASFLQSSLGDVSVELTALLDQGKQILGEGAQGEMLHIHSPYYPRGTSSSTGTAGMWDGLGIGPTTDFLGENIGVTKAYCTRVGNGAFVTEIQSGEAKILREKGGEFGTTTGRPRRVGWLDLPMLSAAKTSSGLTGLALTKIDILGGMPEIPVAVAYEGGDTIPCLGYEKVKPIYKNFQGWPDFTEDEYRRQFENGISRIPNPHLRTYIDRISTTVGLDIEMLSFGQDSRAFISYLGEL